MNSTQRVNRLFQSNLMIQNKKIDNVFLLLFIIQYFFGIFCANFFSPYTWEGDIRTTNLHIWLALYVNALVISLPIYLILKHKGSKLTRHLIAIAQMLNSALLIHLTNGRIETHFHIFGSLAFLMFYRDWTVLITATVVITIDHFLRGIYFPLSVFGVVNASSWRWVEHAAWVVFEDIFLIYASIVAKNELRLQCIKQIRLTNANSRIEKIVKNRTNELKETFAQLDEQKSRNLEASRLAALGEMAGGIAHEINTPLAVVKLRISQAQRLIAKDNFESKEKVSEFLGAIEKVCDTISKIIIGLKKFSRNSENDPMEETLIQDVVDNVLILCSERFKNSDVELRNKIIDSQIKLLCRPSQVSQVLLNLINNAYFAASQGAEKWVEIGVEVLNQNKFRIYVSDSGNGVPSEIRNRIFDPFFTTKAAGAGTGLGLSISKGIMENHEGELSLDDDSINTKFTMSFPTAS